MSIRLTLLGVVLLAASRCLAGAERYLFVDEHWLARSSGLARSVDRPSRFPQPVLDNKAFGVTQPFVTVLRISYCRGTQVWTATSRNGLSRSDPQVACARVRGHGASIIDDKGRDWSDCAPIKGDSTSHKMSWRVSGAALPEAPVQLDFKSAEAKLFCFQLE